MEEKKVLEDLQTIKSFLEEGQNRLVDNGFHFMLWGILIPFATLGFYVLAHFLSSDHVVTIIFWPIISGLGALVSIIVGRSTSRQRTSSSIASKVNIHLWKGFFGGMLTCFALLFTGRVLVTPVILSFICILLGIAYWIYGAVAGTRWFSRIGIVWWITAIVIVFSTWSVGSVVMAGATFMCSFIPGVILFQKGRK